MLVTCNNKGCMKSSDALLDPKTGEVICQECGQPITNISESMKRTLKSFGQVVRAERKAFMMACPSCRANREVVMTQDDETVCKDCHKPIIVHAAFKLAMEEAGGLERIELTKENKTTKKTKKKVSRKKA